MLGVAQQPILELVKVPNLEFSFVYFYDFLPPLYHHDTFRNTRK